MKFLFEIAGFPGQKGKTVSVLFRDPPIYFKNCRERAMIFFKIPFIF